ncbi:MAG: DsbA family protein [Polyangia bacterium]
MLVSIALAAALACQFAGCRAAPRWRVDLRHAAPLGNPDAPIEVVSFSDFQCGWCKRAAAELRRLQHAHPNRIVLYFKHFPLSYHPHSVDAARAAEAARLQDAFWEMHDLLFAHAHDLHAVGVWTSLAKKAGIDPERFVCEMESDEVRNRVVADRAEGEAIGVDGTPFFLINGVPFRGSYSDLSHRLAGPGGGAR